MRMKLVYDYDMDIIQKFIDLPSPPNIGDILELEDGFYYKVYRLSETPKGMLKIHLLQSAQNAEEAEDMEMP